MIGTVNRRGAVGDVYNNGAESSHRADYTGTAGNVYNNEAASSRRADCMGTVVESYNHETESFRRADCTGTAVESYNLETESSRRARTELFGKPVSGSIPTIVRSYKSSVADRINLTRGTHGDPVW